jgi:parallel beta-helix repeat protein
MLPRSLTIAVLVVLAGTVASATADDPPPDPAVVQCGQVLTTSTRVANDLAECPGDGLVIGAPGITLDLNGHAIDGVGLGAGIRNDGHASVTVRNGTVRDFDYGVKLATATGGNVIENLTLELDQLAGLEISDALPNNDLPEGTEPAPESADGQGNRIRSNTIRQNGYGVALFGSTANTVHGNTFAANAKEDVIVDHSSHNRFEHNTSNAGADSAFVFLHSHGNYLGSNGIAGASDSGFVFLYSHGNYLGSNSIDGANDRAFLLEGSDSNTLVDNRVGLSGDSGVLLVGSSSNVLLANQVQTSGDAPYALIGHSSGNRVERNFADGGGDAGIIVKDSDGNQVVANIAHGSSDDGIGLDTANDNLIRANDVRSNTGGIALEDSSGNRVEFNNASDEGTSGIEVDGESALRNRIVGNTARRDGSYGIYVASDTLSENGDQLAGNEIELNTAAANLSDGIHVAKGGHVIGGNVARDNAGWGIYAAAGSLDLGANLAAGNDEADQCYGIVCNALPLLPDTAAPETTIDSGPPDQTRSTSALFSFSSSEPASAFECALDDSGFAPCDPPYGYGGLGQGPHTFSVRAIDAAGNADPTPATATWTVNADAPPSLEPGAYPQDGAPGGPGAEGAPAAWYPAVGSFSPGAEAGPSTSTVGRRIARKCGRLKGRRKRICVRRARALARCRRITGRSGRALRRKTACRRRAMAIGRRR